MAVYQKKASDLPKSSTIPEGTYRLRINKCELRTIDEKVEAIEKAGSNPDMDKLADSLSIDFVVQDEGEFFGRHVFDDFDLDGQYAWRTRKLLEALEYPEDDDIDTDRLVDGELIAAVGVMKEQTSKKTGKTYPERNRVGKMFSINAEVNA